MQRPFVAVDLDDVLTLHEAELVRHYKATYGLDVALQHMRDLEEFEWQSGDAPALVIERMRKYMVSDEAYAVHPVDGVADSLRRLKVGYRLLLLSSRSNVLQAQVAGWVERELPGIFDEVHLTGEGPVWGYIFDSDKRAHLTRLGVDVLVDDSLNHVSLAAELGVRGLLFGNYVWNQAARLPEGVTRVHDWASVESELL